MRSQKIAALLFCLALLTAFLCGCSKTVTTADSTTSPAAVTNGKEKPTEAQDEKEETKKENNGTEDSDMEHTQVKFTMENGKEFIIELYPEYAPDTAKNFKKLVSEGFYDGLTFHRVSPGFMAQGGDPEGTGFGGAKETIKGEFRANGFSQNTLSHQRGVVSMARSGNPNSASSQFFICYGDESFLDGNYAAFGKVIEGMETVDDFAKVELVYNSGGEKSSPAEPIVIKNAVVL